MNNANNTAKVANSLKQSPDKPTIVCLMGPTASGKTTTAIELIKDFPFSIISVDSGMIYRGMDIGTAKPSKEQLAIAPHRLIDILDPRESYSAAQFRLDAMHEIEDILQHGHIPLLVGGTMLYFKVLQQGISPLPSADALVRSEIANDAAKISWEKMHERLQAIDPIAALRIAANDAQRIQRALEVYALTGKTMTELCASNPPQASPYHIINLALAPAAENSRGILEKKILQRLQLMLQQGFVDEVAVLRARGDLAPDMPSMRAVGYRQVWQYLDGALNYEEMQQQIIIATRQLAKRQMTWLRSWQGEIEWFDSEDKNVAQRIQDFLIRRGNICSRRL
jgi:tRNA dimethylallyltransferase